MARSVLPKPSPGPEPEGDVLDCPDCAAGKMRLTRSNRLGLVYSCDNWPTCRGTHGAHQRTGKPLGIPANRTTRLARVHVHDVLDALWKKEPKPVRRAARAVVYHELAQELGIPTERCHVGEFDMTMCKRVLALFASGRMRTRVRSSLHELRRQVQDDRQGGGKYKGGRTHTRAAKRRRQRDRDREDE